MNKYALRHAALLLGASKWSQEQMSDELSTEQIEIRVWAVVVLTLAAILAVSVFTILMSVMFVDQDMERVAPVDEAFLSIIKDVMMLCIGAIGGLVGRNSVNAAAKLMSKEEPK